jgi:putative flippase GtrA
VEESKKINKSILFFLNSAITGALYVAMLFIGNSLLHAQYYLSVTIAYTVAMACYFITNKKTIFKTDSSAKNTTREITGFIVLLAINYGITLAIVAGVRYFTKEIYSGSLLAGAVTITLTYFVFDRIIFLTAKHSSPQKSQRKKLRGRKL